MKKLHRFSFLALAAFASLAAVGCAADAADEESEDESVGAVDQAGTKTPRVNSCSESSTYNSPEGKKTTVFRGTAFLSNLDRHKVMVNINAGDYKTDSNNVIIKRRPIGRDTWDEKAENGSVDSARKGVFHSPVKATDYKRITHLAPWKDDGRDTTGFAKQGVWEYEVKFIFDMYDKEDKSCTFKIYFDPKVYDSAEARWAREQRSR